MTTMERSLVRRLPRTLGEVAMIVAGVLIALFLDDWNERRKATEAFEQTLARVYTDVKKDWFYIDQDNTRLRQQIEIINQLLDDPGALPDDTLVIQLYYLDLPERAYIPSPAALSVREQLQWLMVNAEDPTQLRVVEHLTDYVAFSWAPATVRTGLILDEDRALISPLLQDANIRNPSPVWGSSSLNDFRQAPWREYDPVPTTAEIAAARDLLASERMRFVLEELRARKAKMAGTKYNESEVVLSALRRIQGEYPDLRLQFDDLGIVGSAVTPGEDMETAWMRTLSLERLPGQEQRWQLDLELGKGLLKFRTRDSWEENWGGTDFPEGQVRWYGDAVEVPAAGRYRVTVDLKEDWYRLELLDER
jgi:hypothetical protein